MRGRLLSLLLGGALGALFGSSLGITGGWLAACAAFGAVALGVVVEGSEEHARPQRWRQRRSPRHFGDPPP